MNEKLGVVFFFLISLSYGTGRTCLPLSAAITASYATCGTRLQAPTSPNQRPRFPSYVLDLQKTDKCQMSDPLRSTFHNYGYHHFYPEDIEGLKSKLECSLAVGTGSALHLEVGSGLISLTIDKSHCRNKLVATIESSNVTQVEQIVYLIWIAHTLLEADRGFKVDQLLYKKHEDGLVTVVGKRSGDAFLIQKSPFSESVFSSVGQLQRAISFLSFCQLL